MPVTVVTVVALIGSVVLPSSVFSALAAAVVSLSVMVYALPVPVRVARVARSPWLIVAVTTPVVLASTLLAFNTLVLPVSVTDSLPRPVIVPAVLALYNVMISDAAPLRVVTVAALIVLLVVPSSTMRSVAATVMSLRVTDSSPRPLIPALL